jgi:hypothetical protein
MACSSGAACASQLVEVVIPAAVFRLLARWLLASTLITAGLMLYVGLPTAWLRRGILHVAPHGSNLLLGSSRRWAVRTLARAVELAEPGETILLWPGVYRETVHLRRGGRPGRPLHLRAAVPGQAVISGAAPAGLTERWRWRQQGKSLFASKVPWPIHALRVDDRAAFRAESLGELQELCHRANAWPSFYGRRGRPQLWLCLPDGSTPSQHSLTVHRRLPPRTNAGGHQSASLWIEAPHVQISHLHFDFAVGAAIQLWAASDVLLTHNLFTAADVGINANPHRSPPARLRVAHNAYHHAPQAQWRGWLSWLELYRYSNSSLIWLGGEDLTVEHNLVSQAGDGLKLSPSAGLNRVRGNLIVGSTDDALELDGTTGPLRIEGNLIADSFAHVSASNLPGGPVQISSNIFLNGPSHGHNTWLKLLGQPIHPLHLERNLVLAEWLGWYDGQQMPLQLKSAHNQLVTLHGFGPVAAPPHTFQRDQVVSITDEHWPEPNAGPGALPIRPTLPPLQLGSIGPCWLPIDRMPAFAGLAPLPRSGWLEETPRSSASCG